LDNEVEKKEIEIEPGNPNSYSPWDDFLSGKVELGHVGKSATGLLATAIVVGQGVKLGKRGFVKGIDTFGFGDSVDKSTGYQKEGKVSQYKNNLLQAGDEKRRNMPGEIVKSLKASSKPVELKAVDSSLKILEEEMSSLKQQGLKVPKKTLKYYKDLKLMKPERQMAQAILQKSFKQPVNFKHGGKFIYNSNIKYDSDIKKALQNKRLNPNKPLTVYDVTHQDKTNKATKHMQTKLRSAATQDPRLQLVTKALKDNNIPKALDYAAKGTIKYKGKFIDTGGPIRLIAEGGGITAKFSPTFVGANGKLKSTKEYVIGGHTQRVHFKKYEGYSGLRKSHADVYDITSYASEGEKVSKKNKPWTNVRILAGSEPGRKLGLHEPVVTVSSYTHNKPGGGRPAKSTDTKQRLRGRLVAAHKVTYGKNMSMTDKRALKGLSKSKLLLKLAKFGITKGKSF
tara:strand:- start:103 stop:1464 length:1362 start_codon:yes stop_codon:yes gene_type:complete